MIPLSEAHLRSLLRSWVEQYNRGRAALDAGSFATALTQLEPIQREDAGYRDVGDLITRAKSGVANAVNANAAILNSLLFTHLDYAAIGYRS